MANVLRSSALRAPFAPLPRTSLSSNSPKPFYVSFRRQRQPSGTTLRFSHLPSLRFVPLASQQQQGETLDAQDLEEEVEKDLYASFPCRFPSSRFPIQTHKPAAWIHPRNHHAALLGGIRCMAKPRRVAMVAKQIQRELSDMLLTDKVLQYAILPEVSLGADRYLSSLTTISDVEVSTDLQVVKVFVSVFGDERGKEVALAGLKSKAKYVRGELGRRMKLRLTPEIRFIEDESLERGSRVIAILDRIKNDKKDGQMQDEEQLESSDSLQDDKDWEDDDPDEDIIYIK